MIFMKIYGVSFIGKKFGSNKARRILNSIYLS